jgi:hypothetical protein
VTPLALHACRYLAAIRFDSTLYGSSVFEEGQVDQWLDVTHLSVEVPAAVVAGAVPTASEQVSRCLRPVPAASVLSPLHRPPLVSCIVRCVLSGELCLHRRVVNA